MNLGYEQIPFERFPEGTRVYLMGLPVGRVLAALRGEGKGKRMTVLAHLEIDCRLERTRMPRHPTGWLLRSLEPVPGSERAATIAWN